MKNLMMAFGRLAAVCALALAAAQPAWAQRPAAGVVVAIVGKPRVQSADKAGMKALKLNQFVYEGDTIETRNGERVSLALIGGAEFRINENSSFEVESGGGSKPASLKTKLGQAWTRLLHGHAGLLMRGPIAVASVRGTEADVDIGKRMTVKVYEGLVDVYNDQGRSSLKAGEMTQVGGAGQAPEAPRPMGANDYGNWQSQLLPVNLDQNIERLNKEADRIRNLELNMIDKGGKQKSIKLKFEKQ